MQKKDLHIIRNCKELGISIWQCPQFLFLLMGFVICLSSLFIYFLGVKYIQDFYLIALIAIGANLFLFIFSFIITQNFEKAVQASRIKSELTGVIIHQLRSPLTNLKWIIESLNLGESAKLLEQSLKRMTELTDNLLIISKIEETGFSLRKTNFFLHELVQEIIKSFAPICEKLNIDLQFNFEKIEITADYSQLRMVIENLIDNAIRYTLDKGKIEIDLFKKNKSAVFKIQDQGVGIPEKDKKYIFEKFFRSDNILKNKVKGSGLGLYIVKKIIQMHKGKIWFHSKQGKGTCFYFSI
ncbi:MAG: HAMP domain-containing sensor histidine kinase [Candidatus Pacebacteria bacterium]|jgi:signal transduction histidine kinase|nr:HAMP domain-containing sensor histidine kinase [Candidatus Paceibacterota bacterium]